MDDDRQGVEHLSTEEVAAYLDKALSDEETTRLEDHLAECATCRREIVEVRRFLRARPRWQRWYVVGPAAAAAAAALVLLFAPEIFTPSGPFEPVLRGTEETVGREGTPRIEPLAPPPGATVDDPGAIVFTWRSAAEGATYRLTLTDEVGDELWTVDTPNTTVALAADIFLQADQLYYWFVDALLLDGGTATTGVQQFMTPP